MMISLASLPMLGLLWAAMIAPAPPVEVQTLAGQTLAGPLQALTPEQLILRAGEGNVTLRTEELQQVTFKAPAPAPSGASDVLVTLVDQSSLVARDYRAAGKTAHIALADGRTLDIATQAVAWVRLHRPAGSQAAEWGRILATRTDGDLLVVRKGEAIDYHKGVLGDVSDAHVQFEIDGEQLPVKRTKVAGLIYYHPPGAKLSEAVCRVSDVNGSTWAAAQLAMPGALEWTTPAGARMSVAADQVKRIDYASGRIVYLSELSPESTDWNAYFPVAKDLPELRAWSAPQTESNVARGAVQLGGRVPAKLLCVRAGTTLVYRLPERFRQFRATAGIDDAFRPLGAARLVIRGDQQVLFDKSLTGDDPPLPIELDLSGVRRLTLAIEPAGGQAAGNHVVLADPRLMK